MKRFAAALLSLALTAGHHAWGQDAGPSAGKGKADRPSAERETGAPYPARFGKRVDEAFGAYQRGYYLTALDLARPRAEDGDPAAQTLVAEIYARGLGVRRDPEEAAKWYAKAADKGVPEAQLQYALMLYDGRLAEQNREKAFSLMRSAAEAGEAEAQFNLAQMLVEDGEEAYGREAVGWYERAAEAGLADAQYALAQVLATGFGGHERDEAEARRFLELAARQNYDTAQLDLGAWLLDGRGGPADPEQGFAWLKRAAEAGNVAARNRVAKLYRAGIGTEPDTILAAAWYTLARRAGLADPIMEDFMRGLTEEETEEAFGRADRLRVGE